MNLIITTNNQRAKSVHRKTHTRVGKERGHAACRALCQAEQACTPTCQWFRFPLKEKHLHLTAYIKFNVLSKLITQILKINLEGSSESWDNCIFLTCFLEKGGLLQTFNTINKGNSAMAAVLQQNMTHGLRALPGCAVVIFLQMGLGCRVPCGPDFGPTCYLYFKTWLVKLKVSDMDFSSYRLKPNTSITRVSCPAWCTDTRGTQ